MLVEVKRGRVWLPNAKSYRNKFLKIFIKYLDKESSFFVVIPKDGRFYIPKSIRKELGIKNSVEIEKLKLIKNIIRNSKLLVKNKIDLLSAIPEKTLSGYEILTEIKNNKICCWYCTQGRPKEIVLNRYVPLSFVRLLGYYQAEGGKPKLVKRKGRSFNFTNKRFELIKDFVELSNHLFNIELWKVTIRYNKKINKGLIRNLTKNLQDLGLRLENINAKPAERIREYTIQLWISNSILAESIDNLNRNIKKILIKKHNKNIFENYLRGFIAGDGTFFSYRDKKGSLHSRTYLFEGKEKYIETHKKILDLYGLKGKIKKAKNKNMYILTLVNNWNMLLKTLKYDLFLYAQHHKDKLIWTIQNHKRYRALKYIVHLKNNFNITHLNKITNRDYSYSAHWIRKREKEGLVEFMGKENGKSLWNLTKEGRSVKNTLGFLLKHD